jgi:hypothetical protein
MAGTPPIQAAPRNTFSTRALVLVILTRRAFFLGGVLKKNTIRFWHRAVQNHHLVGG